MKTASHRSHVATLIVAALAQSYAISVNAQAAKGATNAEPFHTTRILAKFKPAENAGPQHPTLRQHGLKLRRQFKMLPQVVVLDLEDARASAAQALPPQARARGLLNRIAALRDTGVFEYVEPDYIRTLNLEPNDTAFTDGTLWALKNIGQSGGTNGADIGAVAAWDITTGSTNVIVAVVDTGIRYTHVELANQMWRNPGEIPGNGIDDDGDGYIDNVYGINAIYGTNTIQGGNPMDDNGHGTHVAGTIGAAANDSNRHVGVAWNVRLMACKALDSEGGSSDYKAYVSDTTECINFAVTKGAKIINASYGFPAFSQTEFDAIRMAANHGVLFVAAAGNYGADNDTSWLRIYPASHDLENIISVAAVDRFDDLASFSSFGRTRVHLGAPGVEVFSCWNGSNTDYRTINGTSMAAPHVVGAAALVLANNPSASVIELRRRILNGVVPIPSLTNVTVTGGRLNVFNSLTAAPTGLLQLEMLPPGGQPLAAGKSVTLHAVVSDLLPVTNATVTASIVAFTNLVLLDSGTGPDSVQGDGVYSTGFVVPTNLTSLDVTVTVSASGWPTLTNLVTYPVVFPPPNDDFANRIAIVPSPSNCLTVVTGSNLNASREAGEPFHVGWPLGGSVWWSWTAAFTGPVRISTIGSSFDTLLAVYTNQTLPTLGLVSQNDDADRDYFSAVKFDAVAGTEYQIAVDGYAAEQGAVVLSVLPMVSVPAASLAEAVDAPALTFTTDTYAPWFGQRCVTHDGTDAARSAGRGWLETTAPGPGPFTFWWKVSSEGAYDYLRFYINGVQQAAISGEVDWEQKRFWVVTGDTLYWVYTKDRSVTRGQDAGWLDEFTFTQIVPAVPSKLGDLDRDGQPTVLDLTLLIGYLQNTNTLAPQVAVFADVNGDSLINSSDISPLADAILGRTALLPAPDTNTNGIPDVLEPLVGSDPNADYDLDGLTNARELQLGTDPLRLDSDGDGWSDDAELADGTNPLDVGSGPVIKLTAGATASYLNALQEMAPSNTAYKATSLAASYLNGVPEPAPTNTVWTVSSMPASYLNALLEPPPSNTAWPVASLPVSYLNAIPEPPPTNTSWSVPSLPVSYLNSLMVQAPTNANWPVASLPVSYLNALSEPSPTNASWPVSSPLVSYSNSPPGGFSTAAAALSPESNRSSPKNNATKPYEN